MDLIKDSWTSNDYDELLDHIKSFKDEKYRQFHVSLVPGSENYIGVRVPQLRQMAKEIVKGNWKEFLKVCRDDNHEEVMLQGFIIGNVKADFDEIITFVNEFIKKIKNWAVCDTFCSGLKIVKKNKEKFYDYISIYIGTDDVYTVRVGLVLLLGYYIEKEYIDEIFDISSRISNEDYYVKMANAWLISICYIKFSQKTIQFLKNKKLDKWTHNKAIQKIIESRRIEDSDRIVLKEMKIK